MVVGHESPFPVESDADHVEADLPEPDPAAMVSYPCRRQAPDPPLLVRTHRKGGVNRSAAQALVLGFDLDHDQG